MSEFDGVVGIVRTYGNPFVVKRVQSLLPFLKQIVVVVNAAQDQGSTRGWLRQEGLLCDPRVSLLEMQTGYTWANALNRALGFVDSLNARRQSRSESAYAFVFPVSVEANFTAPHVAALMRVFDDQQVGIVGTSFQGLLEGKEVSLGSSYRHPRNTGMLIRHAVFANPFVRDFDNACDDLGGMEDIDFLTRVLAFTDYQYRMLDLCVPLVLGKHYHQDQKEQREQDAMRKIAARREEQISRWRAAWLEMGIKVSIP